MSTQKLQINGLSVDAQAIGKGFYDIICENGEEAIVAFGMIPKWIMDMAEKMIREKIIALAAGQRQCTPEEFTPHVDKAQLKATVAPIIHEICLGIYSAASDAKKLVV